jgi:hypothetical protein
MARRKFYLGNTDLFSVSQRQGQGNRTPCGQPMIFRRYGMKGASSVHQRFGPTQAIRASVTVDCVCETAD